MLEGELTKLNQYNTKPKRSPGGPPANQDVKRDVQIRTGPPMTLGNTDLEDLDICKEQSSDWQNLSENGLLGQAGTQQQEDHPGTLCFSHSHHGSVDH